MQLTSAAISVTRCHTLNMCTFRGTVEQEISTGSGVKTFELSFCNMQSSAPANDWFLHKLLFSKGIIVFILPNPAKLNVQASL